MDKNIKSYIGKRGYILNKTYFTNELINEIKKELTVKPFVNEDYGAQGEEFKVFTENSNKLYIPKFYGIQKLGPPQINRVPHGQDINLKFNGKLRDKQIESVNTCLKSCKETGGGILALPCADGKCMGINTPIMMYDGSIKMVQYVEVGDLLMGDDSTPRTVLSLARGREMMYKVVPTKGDPYIVNESHILSLKSSTNYSKKYYKGAKVDMSVKEYLNLPKCYHGKSGPLLGYRVPLSFPDKEVDLDPYMLGYWLGDGNSRKPKISTQDSTVLLYFREKMREMNLYFVHSRDTYNYYISSGIRKTDSNQFLTVLKKYDLINNKHIPNIYKCNSRHKRLELLAGIIDSDGSYDTKGFYIVQKNESLLDDIIFLARSLGFAAYKKECQKNCTNSKNGPKTGTYYRTIIHGKGLEEIPVKCPRKKANPRKQIKDVLVSRIKLEKLQVDNYYGFTIDGNHRYLLGDFTVTHNTVQALYILTELGKKTLIIVHKEFLLNQWKERIKEFLPDARIGTIQQDKVDIEDKDIVIAMLQSISMKEYALNTFDSMSTVIIDEIHRIGSKVFSRALRKVNSQYMIGLSATPNRKDGLTKVFKWYVGDVVYSRKHTDTNIVKVERLIIKSDNENYSKEYLNFRGNPMMPKMINNIVENLHRTQLIVHWIKKLLEEDRKIIVLSDRRAHLEDFYKLLLEAGVNSVGYYVGGMKQVDLDISATKSVILGTFHISAEGLDIPGLDTEILATPKSDIVQSVGRILRKKHEDKPAKIIDVVDKFSLFENQAMKRYKLYNTRKYIIDDITVWDKLDTNGEPQIVKTTRRNTDKKASAKKSTDAFLNQFKSQSMFSNDNHSIFETKEYSSNNELITTNTDKSTNKPNSKPKVNSKTKANPKAKPKAKPKKGSTKVNPKAKPKKGSTKAKNNAKKGKNKAKSNTLPKINNEQFDMYKSMFS